jgi:hypothetical protein
MITEDALAEIERRPDWAMDDQVTLLCQTIRELQAQLAGSPRMDVQSLSLEQALVLAGWRQIDRPEDE